LLINVFDGDDWMLAVLHNHDSHETKPRLETA